jgi:hypothetical protein
MAKERAAREAQKILGKTTGIPAEAKSTPSTKSAANGRTSRPTAKKRTSKRKRRSAKR